LDIQPPVQITKGHRALEWKGISAQGAKVEIPIRGYTDIQAGDNGQWNEG
jgi:hypothetical protein